MTALSTQAHTFFGALEEECAALRDGTAELVDECETYLGDLEQRLGQLRRKAAAASLREESKGTKADIDMIDNRYKRAEEYVRMIRNNTIELARLMQRVAGEGTEAIDRAMQRDAAAQGES